MRPIALAVVGMSVVGCAFMRANPAAYEATLPRGPYRVELAVTADRYLVTEVMLGGAMRRFVVDTGSPTTVVDEQLAAALALPRAGTTPLRDFEGRRSEHAVVRAPTLGVGAVELRDVGMVVADVRWISALECKPIEGILGLNALQGALELDLPGGVLRMASSVDELPARPGGMATRAYPPSYLPLLPPVVATFVPQPFTIDTGSPMAITVTTSVRKRLPPTAFKPVQTVAGGFAGTAAGSKRERVFWWPKVAIGGLDLEGVLTVGDAGATTLGLGVLRHFVVRIARSPLLMTFWPGPTTPPRRPASLGLGLYPRGEGAAVNWLVADSPASAAGVRWGDEVLAIDGEPLAQMAAEARCVAIRDLRLRPRVRLTLARSGEVEVVARPLFP